MTRDRKPITPQPGLTIAEFPVQSRSGHTIFIRSYIPTGTSDLRLIIYLHGGGFVYGGLETDDTTCRTLSKELNASVINVEYRLAPEHPFPSGLEDCQDILHWVHTILLPSPFPPTIYSSSPAPPSSQFHLTHTPGHHSRFDLSSENKSLKRPSS
jgi:hypothetical protein